MIFLGKLIGGLFIAGFIILLAIADGPMWLIGLPILLFLTLTGQVLVIVLTILYALIA